MVEHISRKEAITKLTDYYSERISIENYEIIKEEIEGMIQYGRRGYEDYSNKELSNTLEAYCIFPPFAQVNGHDINYFVIN